MTTAGAFALSFSEVAFPSPPPIRPFRTPRGSGRKGIVAGLLRTIRRELSHAAEDSATAWLPRITNYPY